jgi:hypothetical protein
MLYMLTSEFLKFYFTGGWDSAKHTCAYLSEIHFQQDNQILFGALTSSVHNFDPQYLLNEKMTKDGLNLWGKLREQFHGENNVK